VSLRRLRALAAALQDAATRAGPAGPGVWHLIELATDLERESYLIEAALEQSRRAA
jgi:hypothetical protein